MTAASTRIFLIRHGEVDEAWQGRIYGCLDVPLSPRGSEQARDSAERLAGELLARVVSSGLERAEHTASLLREGRGLERTDDRELREIERGSWAGLSLTDLEQLQPGAWERWHTRPSEHRPPGGESLGDLSTRVLPRLSTWARLHPGQRIAIVTHGWVMRVTACAALGWPLDQACSIAVPTGSMFVVDWLADQAPRWVGPAPERHPVKAPF